MTKRIILGGVAILLVIASAYAAFFIAPEERTMGLIQRIFYFHVSSAWAGFTAFFLCFLGNLLYVWKRDPKYDWLAVSGAEVGLAFTTVVLITGPIWAHPVWGIWWTWDARLTSTFVLWLLYVSYLLLRSLVDEPDRRALLSSLFGIFAFLDVPLVFGAIRWWRTQHPQPVIAGGEGSGLEHTMKLVFFFSAFAMHVFMAFLVAERYALEKMQTETDLLAREAEAQ
ncbi:MAG TPA: cytochrome c biogenesis protein CcsA [Candidatus Acidoferrum sp.]|nr:cytochrome c biogenesis protein CcsA [Candidatus Acidoferrum sp.]